MTAVLRPDSADPQPLRATIYTSRATVPFDSSSLEQLAATASRNNQQRGMTGFLAYFDGYFVQYLEGCGSSLTQLIDVIQHDQRHADIREMILDDLDRRRFPNWGMRDLSSDRAAHAEHLLRQMLTFRRPEAFTREERLSMVGRSLDLVARLHRAAPRPRDGGDRG